MDPKRNPYAPGAGSPPPAAHDGPCRLFSSSSAAMCTRCMPKGGAEPYAVGSGLVHQVGQEVSSEVPRIGRGYGDVRARDAVNSLHETDQHIIEQFWH